MLIYHCRYILCNIAGAGGVTGVTLPLEGTCLTFVNFLSQDVDLFFKLFYK